MANRIQTAFPNTFPYWGGTQTEPSAGQKTTGFAINEMPPAKWLNYLFDYQNDWLKMAMTSSFGNFTTPDLGVTPINFHSVVWNGSYWTGLQLGNISGQPCYYSYDGETWAAGANQFHEAGSRQGACDSAGTVMFGVDTPGSSGELVASSPDPITTAFSAAPDPGFTGAPTTINTLKVKHNDTLVLICEGTELAYASSVGAAWTLVTTPVAFIDIVNLSGSTWLGTSAAGAAYISTNDGVTWSAVTAIPVILNHAITSVDVDRATGVVCAASWHTVNPGGGIYIYRSTDNGASWTAYGVPDTGTLIEVARKPKIRAFGGAIWYAVAEGSTSRMCILYSVDGGLTWEVGQKFGGISTTSGLLEDIDYNGKTWVAVGNNSQLAHGKAVLL